MPLEYKAMEDMAKFVFLHQLSLLAVTMLEELSLWLDPSGSLCNSNDSNKADRAWFQYQKPPEQMHTLFLSFIHKKVKRAGVTLVDEFFVCQLKALVHSHQGHVMLLVHISDPDQLGMEGGKLLHLTDHNGSLQDSNSIGEKPFLSQMRNSSQRSQEHLKCRKVL